MTKHKAPFHLQIFPTAVVLFALVNVALAAFFQSSGLNKPKELTLRAVQASNYETRKEGPWVWWVARSYLSEPTPDVVLLGSSQMGSAIFSAEAAHRGQNLDTCDERQVTQLTSELTEGVGKNPKVFNFAMGGAMASDHLLIAESLLKGAHKPKIAIIGVNPRDFIDNSLPSACATDCFHFLEPYADLSSLAKVSYNDNFGYFDYLLKKELPLKQLNALIRGEAPPTLANQPTFTNPEAKGVLNVDKKGKKPVASQVLQAISGSAQDVRKGQWLIPHNPPYMFMDNSAEYIKRYKNVNPPCLGAQEAYFGELLAYLKKEDIKTIVVGMPSMKRNRDLLPRAFWDEFRDYLASTSERNGACFVDLFEDSRFDETKHFLDTVHLNRWGGETLIKIIAGEMAQQRGFVAVLPDAPNAALAADIKKAKTQSLENRETAAKTTRLWQ
jgi:hypothetical protein